LTTLTDLAAAVAVAVLAFLLPAVLLTVGTRRGRVGDGMRGAWELSALIATALLLGCAGFWSRSRDVGTDLGSAAELGLVLIGGFALMFVALEIGQRASVRPALAQSLGLVAFGCVAGLLAASKPVGDAGPDFDLPGGSGWQPAVLLAFVLVVALAMVWTARPPEWGTVLMSRIGWSGFAVVGLYAYSRDLGAALLLLSGLVGVVLAAGLAWRQAAVAAAALVGSAAAGLAAIALWEHWRGHPVGTVGASDETVTRVGEQLGSVGLVIVLGLLALFVAQLAQLAGRAPQGFARSCAFGMVATLTGYAALAGFAETAAVRSLGLGLPLVGDSRLLFVAVLGVAGIVVGASYRAEPAGQPPVDTRRWSAIAVPAGVVLVLLAVPVPAAVGQYSAFPPLITPSPSGSPSPSSGTPSTPTPPTSLAPKEEARKALTQTAEDALKELRGSVVVLDPRSGEIGVKYSTRNASSVTDGGAALGLALAVSQPRKPACAKSIDDMIRLSCWWAFGRLAKQFEPKVITNKLAAFGFDAKKDGNNAWAKQGGCGKSLTTLSGWCAQATALQMAKMIAAISTYRQPAVYGQPAVNGRCDAQPAPPADADQMPRCAWRREWGALDDEATARVREAMVATAVDDSIPNAGVVLLSSGDAHNVWALAFAPVSQPTVAMAVVLEASKGKVLLEEAKGVAATVLTEAQRTEWQHVEWRCQPGTERGNCGDR
jgi:cell division protein FtsW (lipid II flippase)